MDIDHTGALARDDRAPARRGVVLVAVLAVLAALAALAPAASAAPLPAGDPIGSLDVAQGGQQADGRHTISVRGWAIDPDTASPIQVIVYVGSQAIVIPADQSRPDVGAAYPDYGPDHGYTAVLGATQARQQVCAYGLNVGAGQSRLLGCANVDTTRPYGAPFGNLEQVRPVIGAIDVQGWAIDPDTAAPIQVLVYVDDQALVLPADASRPDVGASFPGAGDDHGFTGRLGAGPGRHTVCAYGLNVGVGTSALLVPCQSVVVTAAVPT